MSDWYCFNCSATTDLDSHGRCERCQSDAVDIAVRPAMTVEGMGGRASVEMLERLVGRD